MSKQKFNHLPPAASVTILALFLGIVLYAGFYVYPAARALASVKKAVPLAEAGLEEQKALYRVQAKIRSLDKHQFRAGLPTPKRKAILRDEMTDLYRRFAGVADRNGLSLNGSDVRINSLTDDSRRLTMKLDLTGPLTNFRPFLIDIIGLEYFESLNTLDIRAFQGDVKQFDLTLDIRITEDSV